MNTTAPTPSADPWADMADLVLFVAREIQTHGYADSRAVALSVSEGHVMRFIDRNPGSGATEVANATGLQRSNLSAALRSLEAKGLVERRHGEDDLRTVLLFPTDFAALNLVLIRSEWARILRRAAGVDVADDAPADERIVPTLGLLGDIQQGLIARHRR
ncbi:MAG: hypothetical protein JWQ43_2796 [Glaciihabitans sp.]|nr:hypothetical protein [Glaciihabitans sp.]